MTGSIRDRAVEIDGDEVVLYDPEAARAWIQSDTHLEIPDCR